MKFRQSLRTKLQEYVNLVITDINHPNLEGRSTDDGIRYQSVIFATTKAFDKMLKLVSPLRILDREIQVETVYATLGTCG